MLRPIVYRAFQATTVVDGGDFVQKLDYYCQQTGNIRRSTLVAIIQVSDLHAQVPHDALLNALADFLHTQTPNGRLGDFHVDTLVHLTALVLRNNIFLYDHVIMRYVRGCPPNLPIIELLGSIFMNHWQRQLVRAARMGSLFVARYHHSIFCTWNDDKENLQQLLKFMRADLPAPLRLGSSIGSSVNFLRCTVENRNGQLHTGVLQRTHRQPFLLPYGNEHPRLLHRQWFRFLLIRAGQYCTTYDAFEDERRRVELTFLANGYSLEFVEYHVRQFFERFTVDHQRVVRLNDRQFVALRQQLFRHVQQDIRRRDEEHFMADPFRTVFLHYTFDWGDRHWFNAQFYKLWAETINTDARFREFRLKIVLISKHAYSSFALLAP